jgi:hypothetical protein
MNYLANRRMYLGSPIEHSNQDDWRNLVKTNLRKKFNLKIFDPSEDKKQVNREKIIYLKENGLWQELSEIVFDFVRADLSIIDHSDFIIQHLPYKVPTTGTHHEIISAYNNKKVVLLVCPQGKDKIPDWYFGFIKHQYMFGSWEKCYEYLEKVDNGKHFNDDRWYFVYHYNDLSWNGEIK